MTPIADRLVAARSMRDIPATTLADRAGLARSQLSLYETGVSQPGLTILVRLADALDVPTDYLVGRTTKTLSTTPETARLLEQISALSEADRRLVELFLATVEAVGRGEDPNENLRLRARIEAVRRQQRATN
ncbi:helix-turn-helix domain-containing protein [Aureimonas glaciei]|uniref:HTH cro/C1-type domain-containing protein n=1 Tax=Aureimonas glaciei TaxID=1776957 RepID=A0A916YGS2_9HYPH|nr:helix-turn-helix domain-containing protein [Aureimonas glaciei]GGD43902.1 hypothetical protein GCM10011335_53170 [Aureimonas glaciei]